MGLLDWLKPPTWAVQLHARVDHVRDVLDIVLDRIDDAHGAAREARAFADIAGKHAQISNGYLSHIDHRTIRMETTMSTDRDFLLELAQDLNDLAQPVDNLIADNAAKASLIAELRAENGRLGGEVGDLQAAAAADESGDLDAARPVREAFDVIAGKFAAKPDLPDVVVPEPPAEPVVDEPVVELPVVDEPAPANPETPGTEQA